MEGSINSLFITADQVGTPTGGGVVTHHEYLALQEMGYCELFDARHILSLRECHSIGELPVDPWHWDEIVFRELTCREQLPKLAHFYSGTFGKTVQLLKDRGVKVTYTIAAHDKEISRREHEQIGLAFPYPHLTDPALWRMYIAGYLAADLVFCPSIYSAGIVRNYDGFRSKVVVIPHGVDLPESISRFPDRFTVGYLGAVGPDKGLRYLLSAWKKLNYRDGTLIIAGKDSTSHFVRELHRVYGGGCVRFIGWVDNVSEFYNAISLYIQPSATEGFGIEVLEAMAHSRPVLCSNAAGAADLLGGDHFVFPSCDRDHLANSIDYWKAEHDAKQKESDRSLLHETGVINREKAKNYTWDKIRNQYIQQWKGLLNGE